ncbi:putative membrane protein [Vibrio cholerae HC-70A1]|nr:putative membrane protein [Vibrio cholerae HC-48A1]EGS45487.1 putative membrane protein [Vibrio cholerae HC-70A1]EGS45922.1 putative membrane protein [Vibrio cholerae HC-40A1]EGS60657.1 putative membrane protein [Vibrio cholerae HFU-02]EGS67262.1 putative membrane protein [Vibrio cholerae BJG-01]EGS69495.1 putative membrane protein [Vibrio cholerae HC-38A1]EHH69870.1 putative membrane protein [Vibrio cholerae HC-06A1]EHH70444.1 putative membrane protein [Vibrio cholerae HC-21A1]EHH75433.
MKNEKLILLGFCFGIANLSILFALYVTGVTIEFGFLF